MQKLKLDVERCKGCYLCKEACKAGAISISSYTNKKGYVTIEVDEEKCVQCASCYTMCPDLVFEIF